MYIIEELIKSDNNVKEFSLENKILLGKVVDCYDADTCRINMPLDNKLVKFNCRLYGVDTPEMRPSKSMENREDEIKKAHTAKNYLLSLIMRNERFDLDKEYPKKEVNELLKKNSYLVKVKCGEFDKYGRLLVELYPYQDNDYTLQTGGAIKFEYSYNQKLITNNYAYAYYGGTKR